NSAGGSGGGVSVDGGHLSVVGSTVAGNFSFGGAPIANGSGAGGGVSIFNGATATVAESTIRDNRCIGAVGGGPAHGAGIIVVQSSSLVISHSVLTRNQALGGNGSLWTGRAEGGAIDVARGSPASISRTNPPDNRPLARP